MEDKNQKNSGELTQEDMSLPTWRRGEGPRLMSEFFFVNQALDNKSSNGVVGTLSDDEENALGRIVHFSLQARYEEAAAEAKRCMDSPYPQIQAFALLTHAVSHIALNKIEIAQEDLQTLRQKAQSSENKHTTAFNDIYRFVSSTFFSPSEDMTQPSPEHLSHYAAGPRLYALYTQSYSLYCQQEYAQALGLAETALALAGSRYPIIQIYLNLAASMAAISLSRLEQADRFFLDALQIAKPSNYIQPFIGHHEPLQGMVEKHIRDQEPELYKAIAEKVMSYRSGWTEIRNPNSSNQVTSLLTPYEFAMATMAAKGKTNQEIAEYFSISVNTVKARLSTIYQKIGISKRSELDEYLNR